MDTAIAVIIIILLLLAAAIIIGLIYNFREYIWRHFQYEVIEEFKFGKCTCKMHRDCQYSMRNYEINIPVIDDSGKAFTKAISILDQKEYSVKIYRSRAYNKKEGQILMRAASDDAKNIVRVHHVFEANDMIFLVMEDWSTNLAEIVSQQELKVNRIKKYFRNIIRGLEYLHDEQGYVHCDLKPRNILLPDLKSIRISNFESCVRPNSTLDNNAHLNLIQPPELRANPTVGFFTDSWDLGYLLIYVCCKAYPPRHTKTPLKFFKDNNNYPSDNKLYDILCEKLLLTDTKKRLWGKELPRAAKDKKLKECFGIPIIEVLKLNLYY